MKLHGIQKQQHMSENLPDIKKGQISISQHFESFLCSKRVLCSDKPNKFLPTYILDKFLDKLTVN